MSVVSPELYSTRSSKEQRHIKELFGRLDTLVVDGDCETYATVAELLRGVQGSRLDVMDLGTSRGGGKRLPVGDVLSIVSARVARRDIHCMDDRR